MSPRTTTGFITAALCAAAVACGGGGSPSVEDSPTAVPGMDGNVDPSIGVGASEQPDNSSSEQP